MHRDPEEHRTSPRQLDPTSAVLLAVADLSDRVARLPCVPSLDWFDQAAGCLLALPGVIRAGTSLVARGPGQRHRRFIAAGAAASGLPSDELANMRREIAALTQRALNVLSTARHARASTRLVEEAVGSAMSPECGLVAATPLEPSDSMLLLFAFGDMAPHAKSLLQATMPQFARAAVSAMRSTPSKTVWVSPCEHAVLREVINGRSIREIASIIQRSPHTVHDHVKSLHLKLNASNRGELVARALGHELPRERQAARADQLDEFPRGKG